MTEAGMSLADILRLPIFPLPNVVLFPRTILPLHIFEPRYKQLVQEALEGDRQIGMALLQPGWESRYHGNPNVFETGGMGMISQYERMEDGKYNIVLEGRHRYRIIDFVQDSPYRVARVKILQEIIPNSRDVKEVATELIVRVRELNSAGSDSSTDLNGLEKLDFTSLVNSICSLINLSIYEKQQLLEIERLQSRAEAVLKVLRQQVERKRFTAKFAHIRPEDPSVN